MRENITPIYYIKNFLNHLTRETPIYKYIPLRYIGAMQRDRRLIFGAVNNWEDVYENYFLKQNFLTADGMQVDSTCVSKNIYGQSWTKCEESDAMWRIYSSDKRTIKVRTTAEKLMDVLYDDDRCMADTYIAKVDYQPQHIIEEEYRNLEQERIPVSSFGGGNGINNFIKESLITKRIEFAHEEEVRIIKMASMNESAPEYIEMPFDPDSFFEEFVIDPRVSEQEEMEIRKSLVEAGIDLDKIRKSSLYDLHKFTLIV